MISIGSEVTSRDNTDPLSPDGNSRTERKHGHDSPPSRFRDGSPSRKKQRQEDAPTTIETLTTYTATAVKTCQTIVYNTAKKAEQVGSHLCSTYLPQSTPSHIQLYAELLLTSAILVTPPIAAIYGITRMVSAGVGE